MTGQMYVARRRGTLHAAGCSVVVQYPASAVPLSAAAAVVRRVCARCLGPRRVPLRPLLESAGIDPGAVAAAATRFGVTRRTVHRWARSGVPAYSAAAAAWRSGISAEDVWPSIWEDRDALVAAVVAP